MTRAHLHTVSVAMLLMLAACPPGGENTQGTSDSDSGDTTDTTKGGNEDSQTDPTMNPTVMTTDTEPSGGSQSDSDSNSDTSMTDTAPTTTSTDPDCMESADCRDANKPVCEAGKCSACNDAAEPDTACAGLGGDNGVCGPDGACVVCTAEKATACMGNTPVCGEDNTCAACTQHAQCGDSACNLETGACFGLDYVLYVDRAAPCDVGAGTMEAPFCKIGDAFAHMLGDDVSLGWTIKIKGGNYIEEPLIVPDGALAVLTRWGDSSPKIRAFDDTGATLTIQNAAKVFVDRISFSINDAYNAITCAGADVWLTDTRMVNNKGQGYESTDCNTTIDRAVIYDNDGGGVASYGAGTTTIVNTFIIGNGTQNFGDYGGVRTAQENELHLIYSTVVDNISKTGPRSLQCVESGAAEIRNSVLIAFVPPSIDCPDGVFTNSAIDEGAVEGDGNLAATVADIMTFFNPQMNGIYTAIADTPLATLAKWKEGDPRTDFDGTPRPNTDGADDYAGADRP